VRGSSVPGVLTSLHNPVARSGFLLDLANISGIRMLLRRHAHLVGTSGMVAVKAVRALHLQHCVPLRTGSLAQRRHDRRKPD
jgi:hypothetical protein